MTIDDLFGGTKTELYLEPRFTVTKCYLSIKFVFIKRSMNVLIFVLI